MKRGSTGRYRVAIVGDEAVADLDCEAIDFAALSQWFAERRALGDVFAVVGSGLRDPRHRWYSTGSEASA